jgi:hypothetical protein
LGGGGGGGGGRYNIILKPKYIKNWRLGLVVLRTFDQDCSLFYNYTNHHNVVVNGLSKLRSTSAFCNAR